MFELDKLERRVEKLEKTANPKGTEDNFHELALALQAESDDRTEEQIYKSYSFDELKFAFGKNTNNWPLWARQKFGV